MTDIEALKLTIEFWKDMALHGYTKKRYSLKFSLVNYLVNCCPLCHYALQESANNVDDNTICVACPLYKKWGCNNTCSDKGAVYFLWQRASDKTVRKFLAQMIVDYTKVELQRRLEKMYEIEKVKHLR